MRVFIDVDSKVADRLILSPVESHHLVKVRRARIGEKVEAIDGNGRYIEGRLEVANAKRAEIEIVQDVQKVRSLAPVRLFLAMPKPKVWEAVLQKCVELQVAEIQPLVTDNCDPSVKTDRLAHKWERWQVILLEALKQSGNPFLPELKQPLKLKDCLDSKESLDRLKLLAALHPNARRPTAILNNHGDACRKGVDIFVGPEGDFSPGEYEEFAKSQVGFVDLGDSVLRVETAAISLIAIVMEHLRSQSNL